MKTIIINTQADLDALPDQFIDYTEIEIRCNLTISKNFKNAIFVTRGSSQPHVVAWESSQPHVVARGSSQPHVVAWESSQPHVEAWESSQPHVVARGSSQPHVVARGSSQPHVVARGSSQPHVVAWESSQPHVEAWESSQPHVVARGSSQLQITGYSKVEIEAHGLVAVNLNNDAAIALLFGLSVAFVFGKAKAIRKSKSATIIKAPSKDWSVQGWLDREGVKAEKGKVVVFKRVSLDLKTQENTPNETLWAIGETLTHPAWNPTHTECGEGKFHACSRPYFCDEFRDRKGDVYVAVEISVKDLYAWPNAKYSHKIAFRKGQVLGRVNRFGKDIA